MMPVRLEPAALGLKSSTLITEPLVLPWLCCTTASPYKTHLSLYVTTGKQYQFDNDYSLLYIDFSPNVFIHFELHWYVDGVVKSIYSAVPL